MKNLRLLILSVLTISTLNAQETSMVAANSVTSNHYSPIKKSKKVVNANYMSSVDIINNSSIVSQLQDRAANYAIQNNAIYDNSEAAVYTVTFKNSQGKLTARYNNEGELLSTNEHYKNTAIPIDMRIAISKQFPGWALKSTDYIISYSKDNQANIRYKVKINKEHLNKTLCVDANGTISL